MSYVTVTLRVLTPEGYEAEFFASITQDDSNDLNLAAQHQLEDFRAIARVQKCTALTSHQTIINNNITQQKGGGGNSRGSIDYNAKSGMLFIQFPYLGSTEKNKEYTQPIFDEIKGITRAYPSFAELPAENGQKPLKGFVVPGKTPEMVIAVLRIKALESFERKPALQAYIDSIKSQ